MVSYGLAGCCLVAEPALKISALCGFSGTGLGPLASAKRDARDWNHLTRMTHGQCCSQAWMTLEKVMLILTPKTFFWMMLLSRPPAQAV